LFLHKRCLGATLGVSLGRILTALVHRTRVIDMIYELLIVLVHKFFPFFVSKFRSKNIILNIEFLLLYSRLLTFTYSIFQSTYYGDILLFIFIPQEWIKMVNILPIILFNI
jgi:hypothetical protein